MRAPQGAKRVEAARPHAVDLGFDCDQTWGETCRSRDLATRSAFALRGDIIRDDAIDALFAPDHLLDDLWLKAVAAIADFLHPLCYRTASGTTTPKRRDKALLAGLTPPILVAPHSIRFQFSATRRT